MDNKKVEEIFTKTYSGLALFSRDANLSAAKIANYKTGNFIRERGFTDMTFKKGGLTGNARYLIASNSGRDVSSIMPEGAKFGLVILTADSYFKVLDVYESSGKTLVFLLNIEAEDIEFFSQIQSNVDEEIIAKARQSFEQSLTESPLEELASKEWQERISFPIGMSDEGELFPLQDATRKSGAGGSAGKPWWKIW